MRERPDALQIRAVKVRAAVEAYIKKKRKKCTGGYLVPKSEEVYKAVSKVTGESVRAISFCMTYSRSCTHPWSKGACPKCPTADHVPW